MFVSKWSLHWGPEWWWYSDLKQKLFTRVPRIYDLCANRSVFGDQRHVEKFCVHCTVIVPGVHLRLCWQYWLRRLLWRSLTCYVVRLGFLRFRQGRQCLTFILVTSMPLRMTEIFLAMYLVYQCGVCDLRDSVWLENMCTPYLVNIVLEPKNSPTRGQPNPVKKLVQSGIWATTANICWWLGFIFV